MTVDTVLDDVDALDVDPDVLPDGTGFADGDEFSVDPPDVDPLFSPLTGKSYKSHRGRKAAETRMRNRSANPDAPRATRRSSSLKRRLQSFYETVGAGVGLFSPPDGQVIIYAAPGCAEAVSEWAESDPKVKAALERLLTGSAFGKVAMAHATIALGIMANHGYNPLGSLFSQPSAQSDGQ